MWCSRKRGRGRARTQAVGPLGPVEPADCAPESLSDSAGSPWVLTVGRPSGTGPGPPGPQCLPPLLKPFNAKHFQMDRKAVKTRKAHRAPRACHPGSPVTTPTQRHMLSLPVPQHTHAHVHTHTAPSEAFGGKTHPSGPPTPRTLCFLRVRAASCRGHSSSVCRASWSPSCSCPVTPVWCSCPPGRRGSSSRRGVQRPSLWSPVIWNTSFFFVLYDDGAESCS